MKLLDTIAAISTPIGKGGVAMIRISGEDAVSVGEKIFRPKRATEFRDFPSGKMIYGDILDPFSPALSIDDGMAVIFRSPSSFTGEDTVEIYCHGGILVTRKVLTAALSAGARQAEAGEFTRRAFLSGKMSLSSAEALGYLLEAKTDNQLRLARGGMRGNLDKKASRIYEKLRDIMTSLFAAIDFPDEDLNELSRDEMISLADGALDDLRSLLATYSTGRAVTEGIPTVICGRTNAGKSSVYNMIVGYDAAIVTDVEGTTRDVLKEQATVGNATLLLCDTAGIRDTEDKVESIGIDRAFSEIERAELILAVFDGSRPLDKDDLELVKKLNETRKACVAILNKTDIGENKETSDTITREFENTVSLCAKNRQGGEKLAAVVDKLFIDGSIDMDNDAVVTGARQYAALNVAREALEASVEDMRRGIPFDLCCIGIETAMSSIGQVDGREIGEDIVSEIFSKFCVGK